MTDTRAGNSGPINQQDLVGNIAAPFAVAANTTATTTVAATGAAVGDRVSVNPSAALTIPAGLTIAWARVSASNVVQLAFGNHTAGSLNWPAGDLLLSIEKV